MAHYSKSLSQYKYYFSGIISISLLFISVSCTELRKDSAPIKLGLLFSRTGTMAFSEETVLEATLMAIDELNKQGGVLGRPLEPIIADEISSLKNYREQAENLIENEKVAVLFGCWTSACRKTIKPIVEKNNNLLVYSEEC